MDVTIRPCESLGDVAALEATIPTGATEMHRRRFELDDGSTYLLAWVDDVAVGCALVRVESEFAEIRRDLGPIAEVNGMHVQTPWQRQGVATALLEAAAAYARARGHDRLGLGVEPDNEPAIRLYESTGFLSTGIDVVAEWTWYDDDGSAHEAREPCVYWLRELKEWLPDFSMAD